MFTYLPILLLIILLAEVWLLVYPTCFKLEERIDLNLTYTLLLLLNYLSNNFYLGDINIVLYVIDFIGATSIEVGY